MKKISPFFLYLSTFVFLLVAIFFITKIYAPSLPYYETVVILVRKFHLSDLTLNKFDNLVFQVVNGVYELSIQLTKNIPPLSSRLNSNFWIEENLYTLTFLPFIFLISFLPILKNKYLRLIPIIFLLLFIPYIQIINKLGDNFVYKTQFRLKLPFQKDFEWFWDDDKQNNQIIVVDYKWKQKSLSKGSVLKVSCLGHYQLNINNQYYYQGPVFANFPKIYYDTVDISKYINKGENTITLSCQYLNVKTHEHQTFTEPGLLVGGYIRDGLVKYKLADYRLWKFSDKTDLNFGERLSADSGFAEISNFTEQNITNHLSKVPINADLRDRPIELLTETKLIPKNIDDNLFDLGRYMNGYLEIKSNFNKICNIKISYFSGYSNRITIDDHNGQDDLFTMPSGEFNFRQFSRRSGRYIKVDKGECEGDYQILFFNTRYPINLFYNPVTYDKDLDAIFNISQNSILNGLQDQIEDSLVRERALYVGDAYSAFSCIPSSSEKNKYFRYILQSFIDSQKEDGSIPSMAHSQADFIIPSYSLILPIFVNDFVTESGDILFVNNNIEKIDKLFKWIDSKLNEDGFFYDRQWNFIDWTKMDLQYQYNTSNQIYLLKAYDSYISLLSILGRDNSEIINKRELLYKNLLRYAYNMDMNSFADSFSNKAKGTAGIITNSLAGKFGIFPSLIESEKSFTIYSNQNTDTPYSQTWLAEWGMSLGKVDTTKKIIRRYWGGMVNLGSTSVYEIYKLSDKNVTASHSHIWGCGPVYLIPKLSNNNK